MVASTFANGSATEYVGAGIARPQAHCGSHRVPRAANGRPYNAPVIRRGAFRMRPQAIYKGATHMEWTDISITVAKRDADTAEAIATSAVPKTRSV